MKLSFPEKWVLYFDQIGYIKKTGQFFGKNISVSNYYHFVYSMNYWLDLKLEDEKLHLNHDKNIQEKIVSFINLLNSQNEKEIELFIKDRFKEFN